MNIAAYKIVSKVAMDYSIQKIQAVNQFLMQGTMEKFTFEEITQRLETIFNDKQAG